MYKTILGVAHTRYLFCIHFVFELEKYYYSKLRKSDKSLVSDSTGIILKSSEILEVTSEKYCLGLEIY